MRVATKDDIIYCNEKSKLKQDKSLCMFYYFIILYLTLYVYITTNYRTYEFYFMKLYRSF